jgi:hypothetical protein
MANEVLTSTVEEEQLVGFTCASCGHQVAAKVKTKGEGSGVPFVVLGLATAQREARKRAERDAAENAVLLASMAKCPACGVSDRRASSVVKQRTAVVAVLQSLVILLVGFSVATTQYAFLPPLVALVAAWYLFQENRWRWSLRPLAQGAQGRAEAS